MTNVKLEPHAALPAHERVAEAKRACAGELAMLQVRADVARFALNVRDMLDPCERETSAVALKARILSGFDGASSAATDRNRERFIGATNALLQSGHEAFALPTAQAHLVLREARSAAGLLPGVNLAFLEGAAAARATIVAVPEPSCPPPTQSPTEPPANLAYLDRCPAHLPPSRALPVRPPALVPYRQDPLRRPAMIAFQMPSVQGVTPRKAT